MNDRPSMGHMYLHMKVAASQTRAYGFERELFATHWRGALLE